MVFLLRTRLLLWLLLWLLLLVVASHSLVAMLADFPPLSCGSPSWNEVHPRSLLVGNDTYLPVVLSRNGWAVVDDTATPRFSFEPPPWQGTQPWYAPPLSAAAHLEHTDLYVFGCRHDYKACLKDSVTLSGPVPLPPLAAFGVW